LDRGFTVLGDGVDDDAADVRYVRGLALRAFPAGSLRRPLDLEPVECHVSGAGWRINVAHALGHELHIAANRLPTRQLQAEELHTLRHEVGRVRPAIEVVTAGAGDTTRLV